MATTSESAGDKARKVGEAVSGLDLRHKLIYLASAALVILFFLPWWSVHMDFMGVKQSHSMNGLREAGWLGFLAALATTLAGLANLGFLPLTGELKTLAGKTPVLFILTLVALLAGPIYFWSQAGQGVGGAETLGLAEAGKTFFFWLALLAALAACGGAAWKLYDERNAAGA